MSLNKELAGDKQQGNNSYLPSISIIFYMILLASSVAGQKLISISGIVISAGNIIFQISYMLIVCITELYGLKQAKRIIITGALCNLFVAYYLYLTVKIPGAEFWLNQKNYSQITLITSSILFTSTVAYVTSEIANATIVSKLKLFFRSKWFAVRAIFSTSTACVIDTTFMLPVIIAHTPNKAVVVFCSLILIKIIYSLLLIPIAWFLVSLLKTQDPSLSDIMLTPFSSVSYLKKPNIHELRSGD
ncbi:MAG: queuosine precursor transporter [Gammaproteobacteria bacterium]|nr:queuosine precursor transporter [Gammaproteobacteria bacterium]